MPCIIQYVFMLCVTSIYYFTFCLWFEPFGFSAIDEIYIYNTVIIRKKTSAHVYCFFLEIVISREKKNICLAFVCIICMKVCLYMYPLLDWLLLNVKWAVFYLVFDDKNKLAYNKSCRCKVDTLMDADADVDADADA